MVRLSSVMLKYYDITDADDITSDMYVWEQKCYICGKMVIVNSGTGCCRVCNDEDNV